MRALHGNTNPCRSGKWTKQNRLALDSSLAVGTINTNGLAVASKRHAVKNSKLDIIALTETHLQSHLHAAYAEDWNRFHCHFSSDPNVKHYNGVALLLNKEKFWKVSQIRWPESSPCHKFAASGRLIASQVWFGHGGCAMIIYNLYAPSGSRWEDHKRRQLNELLDAVTEDSVMRGQVPSILIGDLNMPIAESSKMAAMLHNRTWCDTRKVAEPHMMLAPTCHVGPSNGSMIDHIFVSPSLLDLTYDFQITKFPVFKDHSQVSIKIQVPQPCQTRMSLRKPSSLTNLRMPGSSDTVLPCPMPEEFCRAIRQGQVNPAYNVFLEHMNIILAHTARLQEQEVTPNDQFRGRVQFHDQRRHPRIIQAHASTMQTRKFFQGINRALEVSKAQPGYRRDRTWTNLLPVLDVLPEPYRSRVSELLRLPASNDTALQVAKLLDNALNKIFQDDNSQRIQKWKIRMRSHATKSFQWLKNRSKKQPVTFATPTVDTTENTHTRLDEISKIWKKIYDKHRLGEPSMRNFLSKYGEHMKRDMCELPALTGRQIAETLEKTRPTSPGMDSIAPYELQLLVRWCPDFCEMIAAILNLVESTGEWPDALSKGAVCFIPKVASDNPLPTDFRPLTILSSIYRLWASARHDQLCVKWLPKWKSSKTFGLKDSHAADALAFQTCLQTQINIHNKLYTSGLSYDMQKCFDTIPIQLVIQVFNHRGADSKVVKALNGFYSQHQKHFQIDGAYTHSYKPHNGLVQGCPLSMILLTSLTTTWVEYCEIRIPQTCPRSYADDLSICANSRNTTDLVAQTRSMHQVTAEFISDAGMDINPNKCFTFGHKSVSGCVRKIPFHKNEFRLVGGSIKLTNKTCWTELEQTRADKWKITVGNVRSLPVSWQQKVHILQSCMSQLTFGQGTHQLHIASQTLTTLRATVIRTLLNRNFYDASPGIIFTILATPSIEPEFAMHCAALMLVFRNLNTSQQKHQALELITNKAVHLPLDGPLNRLRQLYEHEVYHETLHEFLNERLDIHKWQHCLRERFRLVWWKKIARERSQHFAGITNGVNRRASTAYLKILEKEADTVQYQLDNQLIASVDPDIDPRPKLKLLRLLLCAGLQTPELDHRHRKRPGSINCTCGQGSPTIYHISWERSCFQNIRQDIWAYMPQPVHDLPTCFQLTTLVPDDMNISTEQVIEIQKIMVKI